MLGLFCHRLLIFRFRSRYSNLWVMMQRSPLPAISSQHLLVRINTLSMYQMVREEIELRIIPQLHERAWLIELHRNTPHIDALGSRFTRLGDGRISEYEAEAATVPNFLSCCHISPL